MGKIIISLFVTLLSFEVSANEDKYSALTIKSVYSNDRNKFIDIYYWYPSSKRDTDFIFGNSKIFAAVATNFNAEIAPGKFPVVLLSHGGMRSSFTHSGWIASALAKAGYIVIVPKPPGVDEITPDLAVNEISLRAADLMLGLSNLENVNVLDRGSDKDNVMGVGFFLGGTSILTLSGIKLSPAKYKKSCDDDETNMDCGWLLSNNVYLTEVSDKKISDLKTDDRIKSIVVINPELTKTFSDATLEMVGIPVTVIDLSAENNPALKPSETILKIPKVQLREINSATAFSAFSMCTEQGERILSSDGGSEICEENAEGLRQENHKLIINEILSAFASQ